MKNQKKKWSLTRKIEMFLLIFGALVVLVPMVVAMTAAEPVFTEGQTLGILISSLCVLEAGTILGTVRRHKEGKDISFSIGACIGLLIVGILQIFG